MQSEAQLGRAAQGKQQSRRLRPKPHTHQRSITFTKTNIIKAHLRVVEKAKIGCPVFHHHNTPHKASLYEVQHKHWCFSLSSVHNNVCIPLSLQMEALNFRKFLNLQCCIAFCEVAARAEGRQRRRFG